jgi:flagellar biosynthesis regulator FlaF
MGITGYEAVGNVTSDGRALEARALMNCAVGLNDALTTKNDELLLAAAAANARLWLFFYSEIERGNVQLPTDVASNIVSLASYVAKVTPRAMGGEAKVLESLISINRNIAAGLSESADLPAAASAATAATVGVSA